MRQHYNIIYNINTPGSHGFLLFSPLFNKYVLLLPKYTISCTSFISGLFLENLEKAVY